MLNLTATAVLIGSIQSAMQQPVFPGKIVIWLLFLFSILSWVTILSKMIHLARVQGADRRFAQRLRQSRTTLELFEEGWHEESSPRFLTYLAGAREAAYQLLGSRTPSDGMQERMQEAGTLSPDQREFVRAAFDSGCRAALRRLSSGVAGLRLVSVASILLGLLGCVWTLMDGFDNLSDSTMMGPIVGSALGFVALSLLVAIPAVVARIAFSVQVEKRTFEVEKFRDDILRLFVRKFAQTEAALPRDEDSPAEPLVSAGLEFERDPGDEIEETRSDREEGESGIPIDEADEASEEEPGKKQYHSIREQLLRPPSDSGGENQLQLNPIARQAATLKSRS